MTPRPPHLPPAPPMELMFLGVASPPGWSAPLRMTRPSLNSLRADRPQSEVRGGDSPAEARDRFSAPRFMHPSVVSALAYSPDGKMLASLDPQGTVCLWDASTGKLLHTLHKTTGDWPKVK